MGLKFSLAFSNNSVLQLTASQPFGDWSRERSAQNRLYELVLVGFLFIKILLFFTIRTTLASL